MTTTFPTLPDSPVFASTRAALHAYSRVLGDWAAHCRTPRKHWWHGSLRPALRGFTTGVIRHAVDFELELDVRESAIIVRTLNGGDFSQHLQGQPAASVARSVREFLGDNGIAGESMPAPRDDAEHTLAHTGYSAEMAQSIGDAWCAVLASLEILRNGIREETSPLQLWPHHFDISLLWLPGELIAGQNPADEEQADKQMNFGFTLGDEGIAEPYFYITAYPLPEALPATPLPAGCYWHTTSFTGAALLYRTLVQRDDPTDHLLSFWRTLLQAGRQQMLEGIEGTTTI